jgi:tetratricopeptide (TPR) repeat protein
MSGQIFISYRRDDSSASAGRLYDRLSVRLPNNHIFFDVDLDPGIDFVEAIETAVGSCDVLIAVIGKHWLLSSDEEGKPRVENPKDFVRLEIATALKHKNRVIPVLVDGALMPRSSDLPDDLNQLVRLNAMDVSHNRFNADFNRLLAVIKPVLEKADAERKKREEKERLEAERLQHEEKERLEAECLKMEEKQRLESQKVLERERLEANRRQKQEKDAEAAYNRGQAYHDINEYDKAIAEYTEAIRLKPNYANAYYDCGLAYYEKADYGEAISDFTEVIRLEPDYAYAYIVRGLAYYGKKDHDKAIKEYTEAIRL